MAGYFTKRLAEVWLRDTLDDVYREWSSARAGSAGADPDLGSDRSQVLRAAAARKHQDAVQRAERAIRQLVEGGRPVTCKAVAEHAPCSTAFLYGHAELKRRITQLREQHGRATLPVPRVDPDAPSSVVRTLTSQIAALKRRHRDDVAQMRHDFAAAHGQILARRRKLGEQRR